MVKLRIKNNMASLSGCRTLNKNNLDNVKAVRKLTSGSRINYAADDAAGLGISEKMRSQIRAVSWSHLPMPKKEKLEQADVPRR